jgi:hypothetical protein
MKVTIDGHLTYDSGGLELAVGDIVLLPDTGFTGGPWEGRVTSLEGTGYDGPVKTVIRKLPRRLVHEGPPGDEDAITDQFAPGDDDEDEFGSDDIQRAKGIMDGATTLAEAAAYARAFADDLQALHEQGYVLRQPVEDDYAFYYMPEPAQET